MTTNSRRLLSFLLAAAAIAAPGLETNAGAATGRSASVQAGKEQLHRVTGAEAACRKRSACRRGGRIRTAVRNGYTPHPAQWPWIARIEPMKCGGTLIRPNVVLTAAHCVVRNGSLAYAQDGVTVTLGRRTLSDTSTGEEIRTDRIVVHEGYGAASLKNDVALLRLSRPSSLPTAEIGLESDWRSPATVMGWGGTAYGERAPQSDTLWAADLPLQSDSYCAPRSPVAYDGRVMMCAGGQGAGSHKGDSGGPLMVGDGAGGGWKLIGVVSFGDPNGDVVNTPSYFAWASGPALRPWIVQKADELVRYQAPQPQPQPAPQPQPVSVAQPAADRTAPAILTLRLLPSRFRAARRGASAARAPVGTVVRYHVSEPGTVRFTAVRRGSRRGTSLVTAARTGINRFAFSGRIRGRQLRPGRYVLKVRAFDAAGNASVVESVGFRIAG